MREKPKQERREETREERGEKQQEKTKEWKNLNHVIEFLCDPNGFSVCLGRERVFGCGGGVERDLGWIRNQSKMEH